MSKIYNELKMNVDRINGFLSKKIVTNKFLNSGSWVSSFTGTVKLVGVGTGRDGDNYEVGQIVNVPVGIGFPLLFLGGEGSIPASKSYDVVKGKNYTVSLNRSDVECRFDDENVVLGRPFMNFYRRRSYPATPSFDFCFIMSEPVGTVFNFSQISCKEHPSAEPKSGADGSGLAGMGVEGKAQIISSNPFQVKVLEITTPAGHGGSGFLEIIYPYAGDLLQLFNDEFDK